MRVRVTVEGPGGDGGRAPSFSKPEITIGRTPANDVVVPDAGVSGAHARVIVTAGKLTILDLDSTNGTFVNDDLLQGPRVIGATDVVSVGDFTLRFSLEDEAAGAIEVSDPGAEAGAPPMAANNGGGSNATSWPEPPPMMDEFADSPRTGETTGPGPDEAPPATAADFRPAMFPSLDPPEPSKPKSKPKPPPPPPPKSRASAPPQPKSSDGFEFDGVLPDLLVDRVFEAVWERVREDVLRSAEGTRARVEQLLEVALRTAARKGTLNKPGALHGRMVEEMIGHGALPRVLENGPDHVVIRGTAEMRIDRGGQVSTGPSPITCAAALTTLVRRLTRRPFDVQHPTARGVLGAYTLEAVFTAEAGGSPVLSLRRNLARGGMTLEALVHGGVLSQRMAALLSACVVARHTLLVCAGPGANSRALQAALMACAPAQELQVAVVDHGVDAAAFRPGTVVLRQSRPGDDVLHSALALGPDLIVVNDLAWGAAADVLGVVSRSIGAVLGLRASTPAAGLSRLQTMLTPLVPRLSGPEELMHAVDLVIGMQMFADGASRVTQLAEPIVAPNGAITAQDIFALAPGSRTWQFCGVQPRCADDLMRRGFGLDSGVFA